MAAVEKNQYKGWTSWHIQRDPLELVLVPQVGGRIMGLRWRGEDLFFTQPEREGCVEDLSRVTDVRTKKRAMGFPLWGGDKSWLAPQSRWTDGVPFLDLDSGAYDLTLDREGPDRVVVRMTSQRCRETGVEITRIVDVPARSNCWTVTHRLLNRSRNEVEWGIWGVTMVLRPGKVYLPRKPASKFPQGVKTFSEEGESDTIRDSVVSELGSLAVIACGEPQAFKFGVDSGEGWMLAVHEAKGGLIGYRKRVSVFPDRTYGHGCVAEVYNSDRYPYFEMETHGPLVRLMPGESFELVEDQELMEMAGWPASEQQVRNYL